MDIDGNGLWDEVTGTDLSHDFGIRPLGNLATPITGDWNGDGDDELGLYHRGRFYLDLTANGSWDAESGGDVHHYFQIASIDDTALPIIGDWDGDGVDDLGLYDQGRFYLDLTANGSWDAESGGDAHHYFNLASIDDTALPVIGDWDGDGIDELGLYNQGRFYLDTSENGSWDSVTGGDTHYNFGLTSIHGTARPLVGDFDGNGVDDLGLFNQGRFYLDSNGNGRWDSVSGGDTFYNFGIDGIPLSFTVMD